MGNLRTGLAVQLTSPVAETTYGAAPSLAGAKFSALKSETLKLAKTAVNGEGILAGKLYPQTVRRVVTDWGAAGQVTMDAPARGLQQWLFPMFGSYGNAPATLTQDGTTGAYVAYHAPGPLEGNSFCVQKGVPAVDTGTVLPVTYVGCKIVKWALEVAKGQIASIVLDIDARNELAGNGNSDPLNASVPALVSYVAPPAGGVFHFRQGTLFTGGTPSTSTVNGGPVTTVTGATAAGNVLSARVEHAVPVDNSRYFLGNAGFKGEQLQNQLRKPSGQIVIEWLSSQAMYNAFAADTATALQLQFVGGSIGSGSDKSTLSVLIPDVYLDDAPVNVSGPGPVQQTIPFQGLDDGTNNVIQATYWTLDSS